jgi:hypothetical protein
VPAEWFTAGAVVIAVAGTWTALHIMRRRWALSRITGPKRL